MIKTYLLQSDQIGVIALTIVFTTKGCNNEFLVNLLKIIPAILVR